RKRDRQWWCRATLCGAMQRARTMNSFRKILVAVEPADIFAEGERPTVASQHALSRAISLASKTGAELTVFSTVVLSPFLEELLREQLAEGEDPPTIAAQEMLERCVAQAERLGVKANAKISIGVPWQDICQLVQTENYDVVIVGTRDLSRVSRILFGSTGM